MAFVNGADPRHVAAEVAIARLAAAQHGVFARDQLSRLGVTRGVINRRLSSGRWERIARDVFRLSGVPRSWEQGLLAACLAWGVGAVISHRAAAALWRLVGFEPGIVELTVPRHRDRVGPGIIHRNRLRTIDATVVGAIPVTTPARTLLDIASAAPIDLVEEALDDVLRRQLVTIPRLRRRLDETAGQGRPGTAAMRALLDARDPSAPVFDSRFERRLLRALSDAGLPLPVAQYPIQIEGRTIAIADFAYPEHRMIIEADGYRYHSSRLAWERDHTRNNHLAVLGWRVVHVTWTELTRRPGRVVRAVGEALAAPSA
jgi:predicted transcriptional regulator of viral defense system